MNADRILEQIREEDLVQSRFPYSFRGCFTLVGRTIPADMGYMAASVLIVDDHPFSREARSPLLYAEVGDLVERGRREDGGSG